MRTGPPARLLFGLFCGVLLLGTLPRVEAGPPSTTKKRRAALKGKLSHVSRKIRSIRTELRQAKRSEAAITADLRTIRQELAQTRAKLASTRERLERTRREQRKVAAALAAVETRLHTRERTLGERLAANYRQGPIRYASVLLGAHTTGDMITRARFVRAVMEYDTQLIQQIKADRAEVLRWKARVDAKAHEVEDIRRELAERHAEEARQAVQQRALLAEARARRAELEDELNALEEDSARIASRLRALDATPEGRLRRLTAFSGGMVRPVPGPVVSRFGMRFHPILHRSRLHAGVDLGSGHGTPIVAAAGGVVVFSGRMRGYGNVIVIDHGGGVSTLYAHCSALLVGDGVQVTRGQNIARVGATGLASGPHLHFEVRKNGAPVNPIGAF